MMNNSEKISVKDFNHFIENDVYSRAFTQLAERKLKKYNFQRYYKYNKEDLIRMSKYPSSKWTKAEFYARLKNPNLDEEIVLSFQKKESYEMTCTTKTFPNNISSNNNGNNSIQDSVGTKSEKNYRYSKYHDNDTNQSWRTERNSLSFRNSNNNNNINNRRTRPKYNNNNNNNNRYDNGSRDYNNEPEPEWFSDGPKSMTDFIDLKGFDDDFNNDVKVDELGDNDSVENSKKDDFHDNFILSDISQDDFSAFLDSDDLSLLALDNDNAFSKFFGNSSRAEKWFKNKKPSSNEDNNETKTNISLIDLFQKKNIDISKLPAAPEAPDLSSAVNVSELEASMLKNPENKKDKSPVNNQNADSDIFSKFKMLANDQDEKPEDTRSQQKSPTFSHSNSPPVIQDMRKEPIIYPPNFPVMNNQMNPMLRAPRFFLPNHPFPTEPINSNMASIPFNPFYFSGFPPGMWMGNPTLMRQVPPPPGNVFSNPMNPNFFIPNPAARFPTFSDMNSRNEYAKQSANDDSMANKLLKNSKFTPTSVFRKLKDHEQSKSKSPKSNHENSIESTQSKYSEDTKGPEMSLQSFFKQFVISQEASTKSEQQEQQQKTPLPLSSNDPSNCQNSNSKVVNPNDIFSVLKANNSGGLELPPLPITDALTLEDLEKL